MYNQLLPTNVITLTLSMEVTRVLHLINCVYNMTKVTPD